MLVRTHPGESRDDCCVGDGGATCCRGLDSSFEGMSLPSEKSKRKRRTSEGSGSGSQQHARFDETSIVYVHAKVSTSFEWGEVLWCGGDVTFFEDEASFISEVRRAPVLCVWRCTEWGKTLGLKAELSGAQDFWASIVSSQGFVPRLDQFCAGESSVVTQLSKMHLQWRESGRLVYTPLKTSPYPWEKQRCWRGNLEMNPLDAAAIAVPPPLWMTEPIDISKEVAWLLEK